MSSYIASKSKQEMEVTQSHTCMAMHKNADSSGKNNPTL